MSGLPKGPLLALLLPQVNMPAGYKLCGAYTASKSDERQCVCGAPANEHGMEPLDAAAWASVYSRLSASAGNAPSTTTEAAKASKNKSRRTQNREREDNRPVPTVKPVKLAEKDLQQPWEGAEGDNEAVDNAKEASDDESSDDEAKGPALAYLEWDQIAESLCAPPFFYCSRGLRRAQHRRALRASAESFHLYVAQMGIKTPLSESLDDFGLSKPTDLQKRVLQPIIEGKNVLIKSCPGKGKLHTIAIAALAAIEVDTPATPQAIIVAGSQETARVLHETISALAKPLNVKVAQVVGGNDRGQMVSQLEEGVHVIVATTGRLYDCFKKGLIQGDSVKRLLIDSADSTLRTPMQRGQVVDLVGALPKEVGVSLFFQVFNAGIEKLVKKHLSDPVQVVEVPASPEGVKHTYIQTPNKAKLDVLVGMELDGFKGSIIVLCRARSATMILQVLEVQQWPVVAVTGRMEHGEREKAFQAWEQGIAPILLTTESSLDVLTGRADLVINYETPTESDRYIARSQACKSGGRMVSFMASSQRKHLRKFQQGVQASSSSTSASA